MRDAQIPRDRERPLVHAQLINGGVRGGSRQVERTASFDPKRSSFVSQRLGCGIGYDAHAAHGVWNAGDFRFRRRMAVRPLGAFFPIECAVGDGRIATFFSERAGRHRHPSHEEHRHDEQAEASRGADNGRKRDRDQRDVCGDMMSSSTIKSRVMGKDPTTDIQARFDPAGIITRLNGRLLCSGRGFVRNLRSRRCAGPATASGPVIHAIETPARDLHGRSGSSGTPSAASSAT